MSDYNRRGDDRYPPQDDYPPRQNQPPQRENPYRNRRAEDNFQESSRGDVHVPDLRQRSSSYRRIQQQRQNADPSDPLYDSGENDDAKEGNRRLFGMSGMDLVFLGALLIAAMRGRSGSGGGLLGCLPGKGCLRAVFINVLGIAMIGTGISAYDGSAESNTLSTALTGGGVLTCLIGAGSVIVLIWLTIRVMDFGGFDDSGVEDVTGGLLGSILGR